ncbi:MOSC domain-containing protein [Plectosphaerella plurivora]|uniref:MOSC domain-containing protein n=1 Tax=Plectosphaerella plurivora TaxID=936078 RepID=A0A9P9A8R7_9PEZI|nr:MOSC domain-containing protein [Plectosphaerella plurivora]
MRITSLHVYPIKALRGIPLQSATITPQGIAHDRSFILLKVLPDGTHQKMQLSHFPQCALFSQEIVPATDTTPATITVRYNIPSDPLIPDHPSQHIPLDVPLEPDASSLEEFPVNLHNSPATGLRMGSSYDAWFSACFGFDVTLIFIGSGRRKVLGTFAPGSAERKKAQEQQQSTWFPSALTSILPWTASQEDQDDYWLTFTDCSPLLITSESSLAAVSALLPSSEPAHMSKFRPNIVLDGAAEEAYAEDFWAELRVAGRPLALTANCVRCSSLNVDYSTGRPAQGETGTVLKKLMKDRRVDTGSKWSPVFGRYGFPLPTEDDPVFTVHVGDDVEVARRNDERTVYDWPGLSSSSSSSIKPVAASA